MKRRSGEKEKPKTITKKKGRKALLIFGCVLGFFLMLSLIPQVVNASGLVEAFEGSNTNYLYSTYALENYDLDFYVDTSWSWLPWNWLDAIGRQIMHALYWITNVLWYLSRLLSSATGSVVSEAYRFDLINEVADSIGENMQRLAGVSASGLSGSGFYPGFLMFVVVILGVYVAYVGLYKREVSRALGAVVRTVVTFLLTTALIVYAPTCIRYINEFSSDLSAAALDLGTGVTMPGSHQGEGDSVDLIRDSLFSIQVYQPWLLLQWGTTDVEEIGQDRVNSLLAASPDDEYGMVRENLVKAEIETYGNMRMTVTKVAGRLGEVLFIFFINLFISIFVILMCGLMILTQILFIVYTLFLVMSFIISMFPGCEGVLRSSLVKVFNIIMLRAGYTLMITFAFTISTMIYGVSKDHSFVVIGFLQIVTFAGIFFAKGEILKMMSLEESSGARRAQAFGSLLAYSQLRRGSFSRRTLEHTKNKVKSLGKENLEIVGDVARYTGKKTNAFLDRRAASWHRQAAAERSAEGAHIRREHDYSVTRDAPEVSEASFYQRSDGSAVTSQNLYDRYFQTERPKRYHASRNTPDKLGAEFTTSERRMAREKYVRPEVWKKAPAGKDVKRVYYKKRFDDKTADRITPDSVGVELKDAPRRYHMAGREEMPKPAKRDLGRKIQIGGRDMRTDHLKNQTMQPDNHNTESMTPHIGAEKKDAPRRYHVVERSATPDLAKRDMREEIGKQQETRKEEPAAVKTSIPENLHEGRREQNMERRKFRQERERGDSWAASKQMHIEQEKQYKNGEEEVRDKEAAAVKETRKNDEENREV